MTNDATDFAALLSGTGDVDWAAAAKLAHLKDWQTYDLNNVVIKKNNRPVPGNYVTAWCEDKDRTTLRFVTPVLRYPFAPNQNDADRHQDQVKRAKEANQTKVQAFNIQGIVEDEQFVQFMDKFNDIMEAYFVTNLAASFPSSKVDDWKPAVRRSMSNGKEMCMCSFEIGQQLDSDSTDVKFCDVVFFDHRGLGEDDPPVEMKHSDAYELLKETGKFSFVAVFEATHFTASWGRTPKIPRYGKAKPKFVANEITFVDTPKEDKSSPQQAKKFITESGVSFAHMFGKRTARKQEADPVDFKRVKIEEAPLEPIPDHVVPELP